MRTRFATLALVALALGVLVAGGQPAWGSTAPTLEVQVIGLGTVTGTGINCGHGHDQCAAAYGGSSGSVTLTAAAVTGWTFDHWEDSTGATLCTLHDPTCSVGPWSSDNTVVAVFTNSGAVGQRSLTVSVTQDTAPTTPVPEGTVTTNSATYDITCSDPTTTCTQQFVTGSTITLEETPASGYTFVGWGGACSGLATTCTVGMNDNHAVTANYVASGSSNVLTINVDGAGTVTGPGIDCAAGSTCTINEPTTSTIGLTAKAESGYAFTGWSDDCAGTQPTCSVQMSAARTVTASFDPVVPVLLTVNGAGTVSGNGMTCGPGPATCSGDAAPDSTIQFVASPPAGSSVTWLGCTSASGTVCNVEVTDTPLAITATFSGGTGVTGGGGSFVQLTVSVTGDGYVSATGAANIWCTAAGGSGCTATVQQNSSVSLHATPASLSTADFSGWGGSCSTTSTTCLLTMSTAKSVSATFVGSNTTYPLKVSVNGSGSVSGGGLTKCTLTGSAACTSQEAEDARVTIVATPNPGSAFSGWSGDCTGTGSTCTIEMSEAQNVTASFSTTAPTTNRLTLGITGAGTVTGGTAPCIGKGKPVTCSSTAKVGSTVDLKATPAKGSIFKGWSGACAGTKPTCAVIMNISTTVNAVFVRALTSTKKPTSVKVRTGYRVTFRFSAAQAGRLTVTGTHKGSKPVKLVKTVKAGRGLARITVKTRGRWVFTLSLRSKSGTHALRYRKTI